jgi:hypothetical protein
MSDHPNPPKTVPQRLRATAKALRALAAHHGEAPADPVRDERMHAAVDRLASTWRDLARELGRPTDRVFPPTDDPAMADVPVDRRPKGAT